MEEQRKDPEMTAVDEKSLAGVTGGTAPVARVINGKVMYRCPHCGNWNESRVACPDCGPYEVSSL